MIAALLAAAALGQEPCAATTSPERDRLSVAWVSPMGRTVGGRAPLVVVPTSELRRWAGEEGADVGRMLQALGLRRTADTPGTPWKVTVFDVAAADLCRPLAASGDAVAGVARCETGDRTPGMRTLGDGCALDLHDATPGQQVFVIPWETAAEQGFCVLPATRFLQGR